MSRPQILSGLSDREAITDAIHRAILGFDHNDVSILASAVVGQDVIFDLNGTVVHGLDAIRTNILNFVGPMDTTHTISNVRVDVKEGASTASLNCYVLAQHCPPGTGNDPAGPKYLAASEYFVDLVKDDSDGLWKGSKWSMKSIWRQGDGKVMQRPG